jgi:broad specificity phosphatase PhoE
MKPPQGKTPPKEPLRVYSIKVTPAMEELLQQLSQDASDRLGWTVSNSAIIRALVRHAGQQPQTWMTEAIHPLVEQEIIQGRVWGTKKG